MCVVPRRLISRRVQGIISSIIGGDVWVMRNGDTRDLSSSAGDHSVIESGHSKWRACERVGGMPMGIPRKERRPVSVCRPDFLNGVGDKLATAKLETMMLTNQPIRLEVLI